MPEELPPLRSANPNAWKTDAVRKYVQSRELPVGMRTNQYGYQYTGFRPRNSVEPSYYAVRRWCDSEHVRSNFSSLLNSLLPHIKVALENYTEIDEFGNVTVEFNLGRIKIE